MLRSGPLDEQRLIDLETKIAYQENTIQELNDAVCEQRQQVDQLAATCKYLVDRIKSVEDMAGDASSQVEKPPHY